MNQIKSSIQSLRAPLYAWRYKKLYVLFLVLIALRFALFFGTDLARLLPLRVELSTPFVSAKSLTEGVFFLNHNIPLYGGSLVHHPPLVVHVFQILFNATAKWLHPNTVLFLVNVAADWAIAIAVINLCMWSQKRVVAQETWLVDEVNDQTVPAPLLYDPVTVGCIYLALPFSVLNCLSLGTASLAHAVGLCGLDLCARSTAVSKRSKLEAWGLILVALSAYISFHHIALLAPAILFLRQGHPETASARNSIYNIGYTALTFVFLHSTVFLLGYDSLANFKEYFLSMFLVEDLTPNIGLYWYFFQEVFDAYRYVFLYVFHSLAFVFILPITFRFRSMPLYVAFYVLGLTCIWKPYPTAADIGVYWSLLAANPYLFRYMRFNLITFPLFAALCFLAPAVHHLWLYWKSGNANYFFGVTLASGLVQNWILSDSLFAQLYREYDKVHPFDRKNKLFLEHIQ